jgi:hypothetical protein
MSLSRKVRIIPLVVGLLALAAGRARAELRCEPPAADLGVIRGGPAVQHRFELVNDGPTPIDIVDVERGCGCLESDLQKRTLKPGERAGLRVTVRTAGQPNGPRSWNLRIRYRAGDTAREELLVIAATIRNEVTIAPSILALYVQDALRQEVVVTDLRSPPLKVTGVNSTVPALRATVQPAVGGVTKVSLEVSAADLDGGRQDAILSLYTDDPLYNPLQLPVTITRGSRPAIAVTPPRVEARVSADQPVASVLVRLRPAGQQKVVIESADADDPAITCTWAVGPGAGATLKVQVDSRRLGGADVARSVQVRLADPPVVLTIPVVIERP